MVVKEGESAVFVLLLPGRIAVAQRVAGGSRSDRAAFASTTTVGRKSPRSKSQ